jgi:hypothetical protein
VIATRPGRVLRLDVLASTQKPASAAPSALATTTCATLPAAPAGAAAAAGAAWELAERHPPSRV